MSRASVMATVLACALGACALIGGKVDPQGAPPPSTVEANARRVTQLDFGTHAHFAVCVEPGCPSRTPKTLARVAVRAPSEPVASSAPSASRAVIVSEPAQPAPSAQVVLPDVQAQRHLTLRFALGSATLTADHKAALRSALPDLQRSARIVVAGRTDDLGSEALNQSLALARGLAVRDFLLDLAPQLPARIAIDARGRCCYVAPNDGEAARSRNRRVEITYAGQAETLP